MRIETTAEILGSLEEGTGSSVVGGRDLAHWRAQRTGAQRRQEKSPR